MSGREMFLGVLLIMAVTWVNATPEEPKVEIWPNHQEVVRFINDSYFVTCSAQNGAQVVWYSPTGTRIPEGSRGRVHAERRPPISGATSPSSKSVSGMLALVFEHIARSDRGSWRCASNQTNHTTAFTMIVNDPISFADAPTKQNALENGEVRLKCDARGDPTPAIFWYYEGVPITFNSTKYRKEDKGLLIINLAIEDRGRYTCKAFQLSTSVSNVQERNITLNVQHKPIPTKELPLHAKAEQAFGYIGGVVNLTCSAIAEPAAAFKWYRNSKPYTGGLVFEDRHISILQLHILLKEDFGDYVCKASNTIGTMEWIISLTEGVRPDPPDEITLMLAHPDTLEIKVIGPKGPVGPSTLAPRPDNLPIIGYRFQYILAPPFEIHTHSVAVDGWYNDTDPNEILALQLKEEDWLEATQLEFSVENGAVYKLPNLNSNTDYAVRVSSRSPAGLSLFSPPYRFTTMIARGALTHSQASSNLLPLHLLLCSAIIYKFM